MKDEKINQLIEESMKSKNNIHIWILFTSLGIKSQKADGKELKFSDSEKFSEALITKTLITKITVIRL